DADGNVYVVGTANRSDISEDDDIRVARYAPDGALVWEQFHNGSGNAADGGLGIAVDAQGGVVVTGSVERGDVWQGRDIVVLKYDNAGNLLDSVGFNGVNNLGDEGRGVALVPASPDAVVAGMDGGMDGSDAYLTARIALSPFSVPAAMTTPGAFPLPGAIQVSWTAPAAGTRPLSGYAIWRQTVPGVVASPATLAGTVNGAG